MEAYNSATGLYLHRNINNNTYGCVFAMSLTYLDLTTPCRAQTGRGGGGKACTIGADSWWLRLAAVFACCNALGEGVHSPSSGSMLAALLERCSPVWCAYIAAAELV